MIAGISVLNEILCLNTRLFLNCLDGVDDEKASRRISGQVNNISFIAVHVVDARIYLANYLGGSIANPFAELAQARSIDEVKAFPTVETLRAEWKKASTELEAIVPRLSAEALCEPSPENFPVDDKTKLGGIAFMLQHESFHIGQMALLRKYFGFPAMSYSGK